METPDWTSFQREPVPDVDRRQWPGTEKEMGTFAVKDTDHLGPCSYPQRGQHRHTEWTEVQQQQQQHRSPGPGPGGREPPADLGSDPAADPGGPPAEATDGDNELERKKKQLEEIENQIIRTKAAIALKKILPYLKKTDEPPDMRLDDKKESHLTMKLDEASLKDRVKCILLLKRSLGLPKIRNRSEITSSFGLWNAVDGQRMQLNPHPPMSPSVPPPTAILNPHPAVQIPAVPAGFQHLQLHERSWTSSPDPPSPAPSQRPRVAKGLQRFLNVLNKGVDINLFTSIVNDDSQYIPLNEESLLNKPLLTEPSKLENNWIEPHPNDSHPSQAHQRCHSRSSLGGSIELPNPEGFYKERNTPTNDELNNQGHSPFPLGSDSSCPPVEEEHPAQLQLQKILQTLGLSFKEEEISGLTNRTKERLYGKTKDSGQGLQKTSGSEKRRDASPGKGLYGVQTEEAKLSLHPINTAKLS
ncbi:unnamed protein product [Merluccius merluccius]